LFFSAGALGQSPGWRGDGSGKYPNAQPPEQWDSKQNVRWTAKIGKSYSTPIVVGNRIFVTAEPDLLLCVDADSGKILWHKSNGFDQLPAELHAVDPKQATNCGYTTPTPVSDGKNVYLVLGTGIVASYDLEGKRRWIVYLAQDAHTEYGRSASPILAGGKLVVCVSHVVALDAANGKVAWDQPNADAAFGTPATAQVAGRATIVTPAGDVLNLDDGKILATHLASMSYVSPIVDGDVVYFIDKAPSAVRLGLLKDGKLQTKALWDTSLSGEYFASPVLADGLIYTCNTGAEYSVLDAATGNVLLNQTLDLPPAGKPADSPLVYPSLTLAGSTLLIANTDGDVLPLKPGKTFKPLRQNSLDDSSYATPVCAGKRIYLRSGGDLVCIQGK